VAGWEGRGGDGSEVGVGIGAAGVVQGQPHIGVLRIEVVERIECLEAQLKQLSFAEDVPFFIGAQVDVLDAGSVGHGRLGVADAERINSGQREARYGEGPDETVAIVAAAEERTVLVAAERQAAGIGSTGLIADGRAVGGAGDGQGGAGVKGHNAFDVPVVENLSKIRSSRERCIPSLC
jgi:hypothetical protein